VLKVYSLVKAKGVRPPWSFPASLLFSVSRQPLYLLAVFPSSLSKKKKPSAMAESPAQVPMVPPMQAPYSQRSLAEDMDSEWRTRKISVMGVVRSFVTQLKPGQGT
jgi:hypothetical protein